MNVIGILVTEVIRCCNGLPSEDDPNHYPNPCDFMAFGTDKWCIITGKSVEENNDPAETRPDHCPLIEKDDLPFSDVDDFMWWDGFWHNIS